MKQNETNQRNEIVSYRCKRCEYHFDSADKHVYCSACFCEDVETVDSSSQSVIKPVLHSQKHEENEKVVSFPTNIKLQVKAEDLQNGN